MERRKKYFYLILGVILTVLAIYVFFFHVLSQESYASDDPLHGSFRMMDKGLSGNSPCHLLVSIDVSAANEAILEKAIENNVDISKGCWVYSYDEEMLFRAEKSGDILTVYEKDNPIATLEYSYKQIFGVKYDREYIANWRGQVWKMERIIPAFLYPTNT